MNISKTIKAAFSQARQRRHDEKRRRKQILLDGDTRLFHQARSHPHPATLTASRRGKLKRT